MKKKLALGLACLLSVSAGSLFVACNDANDGVAKYAVVFETLGGSAIGSYSLAEGDTITRPSAAPTKEMFVFDDWYTDKSFTEKYTFGGKMPAYDITVYAGWTPEMSVEIKYNANGGVFADGEYEFSEYGNVGAKFAFTEAEVSYEGYIFGGWCVDEECSQTYTATVYPENNITLYARWDNDPEYAYVSYYGNGELVAKVPVKKGAEITEPMLWDDDIISTGWYTDRQMTIEYTFGVAQADISLYTTYYTEGLRFSNNVVVGYDGTSSYVVVPSKYNGVDITRIGARAFYRSSELPAILSVSLPSTVNVIQNGAFYDSRYLVSVSFSSNVTDIGDNAFYNNTRLKTLGDMSGVVRIGEAAFAGCKALRSVELAPSLADIGSYAFTDCALLEKVTIPAGVNNVAEYIFSGCTALKQVEIASSTLNSIGLHAFENCSALEQVLIRSVFTPEIRVTSDGISPFADSDKVEIQVNSPDEYKAQFGSYDNNTLANKFVTLQVN